MLTAYVINLDHATQRWARMERLGRECGVDWTRVSAVGRDEPFVIERARSAAATIDGSIPGPGSIACLESHRKVWRLIVAGEARYAAIFEDDVLFAASLPDFLASEGWIPDGCDLLRLETLLQKVRIDQREGTIFRGRRIARLLGSHLGAGAYIVSKNAARRLLEFTDEHAHTVDLLMFHDNSPLFSSMNTYQVLPAPCIQGSVLGHDETDHCLRSTLEQEREGLRHLRQKPVKSHRPGPLQRTIRELRRLKEKHLPIGHVRFARVKFAAS